MKYSWQRYGGYEVSTKGDKRFSAFYAKLRDGRTIEEAYQLDVKGYRKYGNSPMLGKGKPPLVMYEGEGLYEAYLKLWQQWATENPKLMEELSKHKVLSDMFAKTPVNQARALADVLNQMYPEESVLSIIDDLVKKYGYKSLPRELSQKMRQLYYINLPKLDNEATVYSPNDELIANRFDRIVVGDYGAYIEISQKDIVAENLQVKRGQEFRTKPGFYGKYIWLTTKSDCCKVYKQLRRVVYADYRPGKYYISPHEVKQE
jgi:hypothetical protein